MALRRSRLLFGHQNPPKSRRSSSISLSQLRKKPSISLQQAARDGCEDVIQNWLDRQPRNKRRAFVNKKDADGYAALHYAAMFNWFNIMRQLVEAGADPDVKADDGSTPLHFAAKYLPTFPKEDTQSPETPEVHEDPAPSSSKAVELLVKECQCIINAQDNNGLTPLHMACTRGNREAVDILLQAKDIEVNIIDIRNAHAVLHDACILGDDWIVEKLLQKGANILLPNDDGMLPLHLACQEGHSEVAKLILQHATSSHDVPQDDEEKRHTVATTHLAATNVITQQAGAPSQLLLSTLDIKDNTNNTPLHYACDSGAADIVKVLIKHKATTSLFNIDGLTPMHIAARHGFTDIAEILLKSDTNNITLLDNKQQTPLHHAAKQNQVDMVDYLLKMGANIDAHDRDAYTPLLSAAMYGRKETFTHLVSRRASLDVVDIDKKSCMFLAAEHNHVDILQVLVDDEQGVKLSCGTDSKLNTPLHVAAMRGNLEALQVLFKAPIRINARNEEGKMPLHLAAENGHLQIAKALLEYEKDHQHEDRTSISDDGDEDLNTPLHLACSHGHYHFAKYFLEIYADPNARNSRLLTPMHCAASGGWDQILELLIEADANISTKAEDQVTPLHLACEKGNLKCVEILIHYGADVRIKREQSQFNCLDVAIENGQERVAMAIIQSKRWDEALRNTTGDKKDTPMRKLIRRMPSVAEAVLNRCMKVNDDQTPDSPDFEVAFNFEFLEDFSRPEPGLIELATELQSGLQEGFQAGLHGLQNLGDRITKSRGDLTALEEEDAQSVSNEEEDEEEKEKSKYWFTSWGPPEFEKSNHPLSIMVESEQTCLLKHPLVTTLLDYKWRHYTSVAYLFNFAIYIIFVLLLTAFALEVHNPQDEICKEKAPLNETGVNGTVTKTGCADRDRSTYLPYHFDGDPDKRPIDFWYLFLSAITITFLAMTRLVMEAFQLLLRRREYVTDWINWLENLIFGSSIVFVWIFHSDCYCETSWKWQVGVIAVFCAWIDLIIFVEKIPFMGIYVVMFLHIFYTFLRMAILAFLLVVSFSLAFYMLFYEPDGFSRFPFATPGRSIIKTFTMTTGEFDFDTLFHQTGDEEDDIEYLPVSVIIWFIFIVLMPILLTNLLVGLAVGDIQEIQEVAVLKRLELQVDLALSVEKRMPSKMRQWLLTGEIKIRPNQKPNLCERFLYTIWGGRGCDPAEIRQAALQSKQQKESDDDDDVQQHTKQLVNDMDAMKRTVQEMNVFLSQIAKKMDIPAAK